MSIASRARHTHTVTVDHWLLLKSDYSRRCAPRLGREHEASEMRLAAQAAEEQLPALDSHLPHN